MTTLRFLRVNATAAETADGPEPMMQNSFTTAPILVQFGFGKDHNALGTIGREFG
jgi:hypothetical protein